MEFMGVERGALAWPVCRESTRSSWRRASSAGLRRVAGAGLQGRGRQEAVLVSPDR